MTQTAHGYLHERFTSDATTLRERAAALAKGAKIPGPDAAMSRRMADACADVASRVETAAQGRSGDAVLEALLALVSPLLAHADRVTDAPAVKAVYSGAATRIREVVEAERRAMSGADHHDDIDRFDDDDDDGDGDA